MGRLLENPEPEIQTFIEDIGIYCPRPWICPLTASLEAPGGCLQDTLKSKHPKSDSHSGGIHALAVTADGLNIVACDDERVTVWDATWGEILFEVEGCFWKAAISPDGRRILLENRDGEKAYDVKTKEEVVLNESEHALLRSQPGWSFPSIDYRNYEFTFMTDRFRVVVSESENIVRLFDHADNRELAMLVGHSDEIRCIAIPPDESFILTGSKDHSIKIWEPKTSLIAVQSLSKQRANSLPYLSKDGWTAMYSTKAGSICVWALDHGNISSEFSKEGRRFSPVDGSMESRVVACMGQPRDSSWDSFPGTELWDLPGAGVRRVLWVRAAVWALRLWA